MSGRRQMVAGDWAGQRAGSGWERRVVRLACAAVVAVAMVSASEALAQPLTISHLAGTLGGGGVLDGTGAGARFNNPGGLAVDAAGTVYVADVYSHTIRKISAAGVVTTFAGLANAPGITDGTGAPPDSTTPMASRLTVPATCSLRTVAITRSGRSRRAVWSPRSLVSPR